MKRFAHALLLGLLVAIVGASFLFSPLGRTIEEDFGLPLLFTMRGVKKPPQEVVIVNIDHESNQDLFLSENFRKWPRWAYADLVDKLHDYGADVIVFDVHFAEPKNIDHDLLLAEAIRKAGNVILYEELRRKSIEGSNGEGQTGGVEIDILVPPIRPLADAAMALAPFPVPKIPLRINQAWMFKPSGGGVPTLPVVALQAVSFKYYDRFEEVIGRQGSAKAGDIFLGSREVLSASGIVETILRKRTLAGHKPELEEFYLGIAAGPELSPKERKMFLAIIGMYWGENSIYLNYYGPPATLTTFSYREVVAPDEGDEELIRESIRGKVVFVGAAKRSWSGQKDGFYTVFSEPDGLDLSGVELAATAYANLLEKKNLRILHPGLIIILLVSCGILASVISFMFRPGYASGALILYIAGYLFAAKHLFGNSGIWLPIITPIILMVSISALEASIYKFLMVRRERRHIRKALGYYLPDNVVEELTTDLSFIKTGDQMVHGVCLLTDAENYTTLSESMKPADLSAHMKEYYQYLFKQVNDKGGRVCNTIGDSMLAIWPSPEPEIALKGKACQAALQIQAAAGQFNQKHPQRSLPTRIGLHSGYLLMGNIGAEDHFEYAPVGDIVNTVSRIEELNKKLGTKVVASGETIQELTNVETRELGTFLLGGKTKPVTIHELLAREQESKLAYRLSTEVFPEALVLFRQRKWTQAMDVLNHCLSLDENDGPSKYYLELCKSYIKHPPSPEWQGVIQVEK